MFKVASLPLSSSVSGDDLGSGSSACPSSLGLLGEGPWYFPLPLQGSPACSGPKSAAGVPLV